ncbi:MAG: hypothetical protein RL150_10, partial [Candidatus Parcubacteria bacterium]
MPTSSAFEDRYKTLNASQRAAVDTIEGPVMVIAGPGTGKTTILTLRIANILLKTDTAPENILALTFTESGVYAIRKKLVSIIGNAGYRVRIHTFHSFCNEIISQYPEYFPRIIGGSSIEAATQLSIVERIVEEGSFTFIKPFGDPYYYVDTLIRTIRDLKREGVSAQELRTYAEASLVTLRGDDTQYNKKTGKLKTDAQTIEKKLERTLELATVYEAYQAALAERVAYDFEDMILEVVHALKQHEELLQTLQEEYQYLLADEHQDTNNAQNQILELLASFHESPNLFIVGDEKQAIYRFQGASLENFLYFKGRYSTAVLITLETNYRSTQTILDTAHELILNNVVDDPMLRARLTAGGGDDGAPIAVYEFSDERYEDQFIASHITERLAAGVPAEEIVVLYRNNGDIVSLLPYLERAEIPYTLYADRNLLTERDAMRLLTLLRAVARPLDDTLLSRVLHMDFLGIDPVDAHRMVVHAKDAQVAVADVLLDEGAPIAYRNAQALDTFRANFLRWTTRVHDENPLTFLEGLLRTSGLLQQVLAGDGAYERLAIIDSLFNELGKVVAGKPYATIEDVLKHIDLLEAYKIRVPVKTASHGSGVALMTAHRSKGLEFTHVYIRGATDKRWGGKTARTYFALPFDVLSDTVRDADERRLFYVALTRAKETITITYGLQSADGRSLLPSQFIAELKQELVSYEDGKAVEANLPGMQGAYVCAPAPTASSAHDVQYLRERFLSQPFSVTALNNYLSCPWQYFFRNLIRLPSTYSKHQQYGSAMHNALKLFFDAYATGKNPTAEELAGHFSDSLTRSVADPALRDELYVRGTEALRAYVDTWQGTWPRELKTEYTVHGIEFPFAEGVLTLTGAMDKLEFVDGHHVNVVDYKTGKPKSRNALMGTTKGSDGDYHRQLIFYKLLLDKLEHAEYVMDTGTIEFIEPEHGTCRKEVFAITPEEVEALEAQLRTTASD